jgi:malonate transporter
MGARDTRAPMSTLTGLLAVSLPFFLLVLLGFAAARRGIVPVTALGALNAFVLYLALPAMLLQLGRQWAHDGFSGAVALPLYALASLGLGLLAWRVLAAEPSRGARGMAALVTLFPNTGFLGVPLLGALLGQGASSLLVATIVFDLIVTSSVCLALAGAREAGLRRAVRNPLPWAVLAGVVMGLAELTLPAPLERTLQMLAQAVSPTALVALGVALAVPQPAHSAHGTALRLAVLKLVAHPLLAGLLGYAALRAGWIGLPQLQLLVLATALPGAANVALLAQQLGEGQHLVPRAILASTLGAPLTLPLVAWALGVQA